MQQEEVFYPPTLQDITLDDQGRVVINDPQINEDLTIATAAKAKAAAKAKPTTKPLADTNVGCTVNNAAGCGVKKLA